MSRRRRSGRLLVAAALLASATLPTCRVPVRGNGLNVLLITLETTRADHLGAYGYERDTSPRIDALAASGALFENAGSVSPRTNPSLATLMTSRYPHEHGVRNLLLPLEPEHRTLAELLRDAGYRTGAIQTHPRLVAASGFAQGFRDYDDDIAAHPLADQSCGKAQRWIREASRDDRPWFLWLHVMDPHWTYDPRAEWAGRFGPVDPRPGELYRALEERRRTIGPVIFSNRMEPDEVAAFVRLYDAEIAFTDAAVGALLDVLGELGLRERTVVVLTADHGESLGEHDYFFEHGDFGTEPEIHVPLVIASPRGGAPGARVPWSVSSLDVAPTVTDLLGIDPEGAFRGRSLVPLLADPERGEHRRCFGETGKRFHEQNVRRDVDGVAGKWRWLREGRYKLVHVPRPDGTAVRRLHDLDRDPGELRDVSAEHADIVQRMSAELDAWLTEDPGEERDYHITPELREELRSLGYVN